MTSTTSKDDQNASDSPALLTVLTTEHFALQGARGSTVSESSARATLYVGAVSSSLVAFGFFAQGTDRTVFNAFALVVLPTVYTLGVFTFARLVASSIEDLLYGRAINRIRQYYLEIAGNQSVYIVLGAHDDPHGVLANMGITKPTRWQLFYTLATMIAVLNAVVAGSAVAFVTSLLGTGLYLAAGMGAAAAILSIGVHLRWQTGAHDDAREGHEARRPSRPNP